MIKDYDLTINFTPGKANVVADALSRKSTDVQPIQRELPKELKMDLERSEILLLEVHAFGSLNNVEVTEESQSNLRNEIIRRQKEDPFLKE